MTVIRKKAKRIAMIGMYGGYYRGEYNPGCIMICQKTYRELKKRIKGCEIDIFAIDNKVQHGEIRKEQKDGLCIHFFPAGEGESLLNSVFSRYDALVLGGDVIWDDFFEKSRIFFINSEPFLATRKPLVLFNCVHRFNSVAGNKELFLNIHKRSDYIAVRTPYFSDELKKIGVGNVRTIPDPVLDFDTGSRVKTTKRKKPLIGISVSVKLCDPLISFLSVTDLSQYDVCIYSYSRQYENHITVMAVESFFGDRFSYIKEYKDPMETFELIAGFDISVSDTYHGTIAALIQQVPFICINTEPPASSRITHLLKPFGLEKQFVSIYPQQDETGDETANRCLNQFNELIKNPPQVLPEQMYAVKKRIQEHFDEMAEIIQKN